MKPNPIHTKYPLLVVAVAMIATIVLVVELSPAVAWSVVGAALAASVVVELTLRIALPLVVSLFAMCALLLTLLALPATQNLPTDRRYQAIAVVQNDPTEAKKWQRVSTQILATRDSVTDWRENRLSTFVNIDTSLHLKIKRGDTIALSGFLRQIGGSYGERLAKQGITGQFYTHRAAVIGRSDTSFFDRVDIVRHRAADRIRNIDTAAPAATSTLTAITIGLRSEMPRQTVVDYRRTGVAHLLAISGLHIGIVVALLNLLLAAIRPWSRAGRYIYSALIILLLWSYALFSGMSPSVMRAVVMFTLYQIATMIYRDGTSLNVLSAAAVVLLLFDPLYLYDLGFQLSFVAMAGIATLYRPIHSLWIINNRVARSVWSAVVVALAAQIAVLPLSVYYFGYLPYLGLPVGLILWALVPVMIASTLLFLLTSWTWIGQIGVATAELQNELLALVSSNRWIVAEGLTLPLWALLMIYAVMIAAVVAINFRRGNRLRRKVLRASQYNI